MIERFQKLDWGLIITILSFLYAIYIGVTGKKKQQIAFAKSNYNIVEGGGIEGLEINFKGKKIKKATITKLAIWNCGNITINREDVVSTKPLTIKCSGEIFNVKIIKRTDESNLFNISKKNDNIILDFEYLDPRDGVIVQIIHDSKNNDVELRGKIKGKLPIKNIDNKPKVFKKINLSRKKRKLCEKIMIMIMFTVILGELIITDLVCLKKLSIKMYSTINFMDNNIISRVLLILLNIISLLLAISILKRCFLINVPTRLRQYDEYDDEKINNAN